MVKHGWSLIRFRHQNYLHLGKEHSFVWNIYAMYIMCLHYEHYVALHTGHDQSKLHKLTYVHYLK